MNSCRVQILVSHAIRQGILRGPPSKHPRLIKRCYPPIGVIFEPRPDGGRIRMQRVFRIGDNIISDDSPSYVIAEIGHNHQGDLEQCKNDVHRPRSECGANAVKLQKRDNRALFTQAMFDAPYLHPRTAMARLMANTVTAWNSPQSSTSN